MAPIISYSNNMAITDSAIYKADSNFSNMA